MHTLAIKLQADRMANPDLDIRYSLPDLLNERSDKSITDDGYDYVGEANDLLLYLKTDDLERAVTCLLDVLSHVQVLGNDLGTCATAAVQREGTWKVIFPTDSHEPFP